MKKTILSLFILMQAFRISAKVSQEKIMVNLRNNSVLPHSYTFIIYKPNEKGNATIGKFLMPYKSVSFKFTAGTKIYIADKKQVNTVMSGSSLSGKPFLTIDQNFKNKTINILK